MNPCEPLLLSVDDTARLLGLGRRTLYSLMNSGKICPSYRLGGRRCFRRDDLNRWVEMGMPSLERFQVLTGQGGRR